MKYFKSNNFVTAISVVLTFLLYSCGSSNLLFKTLPQISNDNGFSQPRFVEGELVVHIRNINVLSGDSLKQWNKNHDVPENQKPTLMLWSSDIKDQVNQREVKDLEYSPKPTDNFIEADNGNRICYWNLSNELENKDSITVIRKFTYTAYDYRPKINKNIVDDNWNKIPLKIKKFYTKSENLLELTPAIVKTAKQITDNIKNPLDKAHAIYKWVRDTMKYVYPPKERGAAAALKTCTGDCGQYSALFIALARAVGIPARQQSGFMFMPDNKGYHVWSEIYLPGYGWEPVDATKSDGFLHIDNKRLIASVGMNIPVKHAPKWANYKNSEINNNRVDFMQLVSTLMTGVNADLSTDLIVKKSEPVIQTTSK